MARRVKFTAEEAISMILNDDGDTYEDSGNEMGSDDDDNLFSASFGDCLQDQDCMNDAVGSHYDAEHGTSQDTLTPL